MLSSPSTSRIQALCLLLVILMVTFAHLGAASAAAAVNSNKMKPLPGSCLMAASTLCANTDTNAMRCLRTLAIKGDARVPPTCAEALMAGVTKNPRRTSMQAARTKQLSRLLTEGACNSCPNTYGGVYNQCNDVLTGCNGCPQGTFVVPSFNDNIQVATGGVNNPNTIACSNICCQGHDGRGACCVSYATTDTAYLDSTVICFDNRQSYCDATTPN